MVAALLHTNMPNADVVQNDRQSSDDDEDDEKEEILDDDDDDDEEYKPDARKGLTQSRLTHNNKKRIPSNQRRATLIVCPMTLIDQWW